jgi:hypothetical protein
VIRDIESRITYFFRRLKNKNDGVRGRGFALCLAAALALAVGARAPEAAADDLKYVETQDLRIIYYDPWESYLIPHVTQSFLSALASQKRLFDYSPDGKVNVFLRDFSDQSNAFATPVPRDRITFDIAAGYDPYETVSSGDWYATTAVHETTHLADNDRAAPVDERFRHFFHGKVDVDAAHPETLLYFYLTVPRRTAPRWYQEGSAVFMETWLSGGVGRAQGGYDEMVFRAMVQDGAKFYDPLGLVSKGTEVDFQTGANAYLYGTRFDDYLALMYGPQKLIAWWRRDAGSRRYYADQFQLVFGLPLNVAWQQWIEFEHGFQHKNLEAVHQYPVTTYRDVTHRTLGAMSRTYLSPDGSKLYAAVRYPGQVAHIVAITRSDGAVHDIKEVKHPSGYTVTSLAFDPASATVFYTTNVSNYRNLEALDLRTGKARLLLKAARIGDIVYNPADRSLWGLRLTDGVAQLVRIPYPYRKWVRLYEFPEGEKAFDLDLSADGTLASFSVSGPASGLGSAQVRQLRIVRTSALEHGDATPLHKLQMGAAVPEGFVFSSDGRYLYGSSYYTGVSNIYRYELATEKLDAVSNAAIGFFRPMPLDESHLLVLRYSATGFVPATIEIHPTEDLSAVTFLGEQVAAKYPEVTTWTAAAPASIPHQSQVLSSGAYHRADMSLESVIPVIEGFQDSVALGARARFSDPLGFDWVNVDLSYSPDNALPSWERLHFSADGRNADWTGGVAWNGANFYDLFGPTKRAVTGYNGYVGYDQFVVYEPPETLLFAAKVAFYGDLDQLPGFQNIPSPSSNLFTAKASLKGIDTRQSPGAVDAETGYTWSLTAHLYGAAGEVVPSIAGTYDLGFPLPLDHSSIWLRTGAFISGGSPYDPLANAYLGSFGNNYVDTGAYGGAQRYRELLSMPGFDIDALAGKSLVKGMLEWCLPPVRFAALGSPGFYASWARPEVFVGALETNLGTNAARVNAYDVGAQLDFQLHVMHREPMMLSFGVARGYAAGGLGLGTTEFMLSLQVL